MGGISVVWSEYLMRLKDRRDGLNYCIFYPENTNRISSELDLSLYDVDFIKPRGSVSKYFPFLLRGNKKDILHTSYYQWYPLYRGIKVVTLHDFMHEKFAPFRSRFAHNVLKYLSLNSADVILCISEATKKDLEEIYPNIYSNKDVRVIENAVSDVFYPDDDFSDHNNEFLWVAGRSGYKNFKYALKILQFLKQQERIYSISVVGPELTDEEKQCAVKYGVLEQVNVFSNVSMDALRAMYSDALALLYLSKYEGFGLPILEAQKCQCPVIALKNPASLEVGRDSVLYIEDNNEHEILDILPLVSSVTQREKIVNKGIENSNRYSWDTSVEKLVRVYKDYYEE